jgi:hypothetical protein
VGFEFQLLRKCDEKCEGLVGFERGGGGASPLKGKISLK